MRKYAIIIGAMKAGTSSLYNYLAQHPEVARCRVKEPEFFGDRNAHENSRRLAHVSRYEKLWRVGEDFDGVCLEASTGYTKAPFVAGVPDRMKAAGLDPYLIYLVRDPVARAVSHINYQHIVYGDKLVADAGTEPIEVSRYAAQLDRYRAAFGPSMRLKTLEFEHLTHDPLGATNACLTWLGLDPLSALEESARNVTSNKKVDFWLGNVRGSGLAKRLLRGRTRTLAQRLVRSTLPAFRKFSPPQPQPALDAAMRERIHALLEDDMQRLREVYGVDTTRWGF